MRNLCPHRYAISPVKKIIVALSLTFLTIFMVPGSLKAQSNISGDIAGTVTDPSGAAVPNAKVTVSNPTNGEVKATTSGSAGEFRVSLLSPGTYKVSATAAGFETTDQSITVSAGTVTPLSVKLTVGSGTTTVEVTGNEVALLNTDDAQVSTTFNFSQIQSLPNPGNDLTFVAQTAPGAVMNTQGGYGNFSVFGLPATSNTFTVNGGYEGDPYLNLNNSGATNLLLGNNDVDNVTVTTNAYDAAFGGLGGAQVNEISRAGTNRFHGNAVYWWNGSSMNANSYFNKQAGSPKNFSNVNQWAASIGGPIKKDKMFFFVDTEGLRVIIPNRATVYAPSPSYQAAILNPVPTTNVYAPYGNLAANGNLGEAPLYQTLFNYYNNARNFTSGTQDPVDPDTWIFNGQSANLGTEWQILGRTDFNLGTNDHLFIHFKVDHGTQPTSTSFLDPIFDAQSPQPSYEGQLNENHSFSPALINQFVFAASYYRAIFTNTNATKLAATVPFVLIPEGYAAGGDWDLTGNANTWVGNQDYAFPQGRNVTGYQFNDDLSWTKGQHSFKFGWTMRRDDITDYTPSEHNIAFAGGENIILDQGDFAAGYADEWAERFPQHLSEPVALYVMGWYAQDQWKVSPKLTLTGGLRMEHNSNPICQTNCVSNFSSNFNTLPTSSNTAYNTLLSSGLHQGFFKQQNIAWEPRVGFAWVPDPKTTVRGGFGMFADYFPAQIMGDLVANPPNVDRFTVLGPYFGGNNIPIDSTLPTSGHAISVTSNQAFQQQFPLGGSYNSIHALTNGVFSRPTVIGVQHKVFLPSYEEWSLAVQREVAKNVVASLTYVGNHGYHEPVQQLPNAYNAAGTNAGLPSSRPNNSFNQVTNFYSGASSNYNGMVFSVVDRAKWVSLQFNYAYGHALDECSNGCFNAFGVNPIGQINPNNLSQNYGNADYDTRNYISASYVITVPYWGGPHVLTDNWMIAGTIFHNTGYPFSVNDGTGDNVYGTASLAKQIDNSFNHHCGGTNHTLGYGVQCDFAAHFASSTDFGQQRRNQLYGPNYSDFDLDISKGFKMPHWEGAQFKAGAQFFNTFNHPNFQIPTADVTAGSSNGIIQSTASTPTSILGAFLGGDASPRLIQLKASFVF
jgi:outer membrane receptor protein involved in Fe transport